MEQTKPICEWPTAAPKILDGLLGPKTTIAGLYKDPNAYQRPAISDENLILLQQRINLLAPSQAEQALREVNDYVYAPYPQYFQRLVRQRGWSLYRATKRWWKNGVDYMLPGDYVLARERPDRDPDERYAVFVPRERCTTLVTDIRHITPVIF